MGKFYLKTSIFIILFLGLLFASDPISIVQYPLLSRPVITLAGGTFQIECKASSSILNWQARLYTEFNEVNLSVSGTFDNTKQRWFLTVTIPSDAPFELYDLEVKSGGYIDQVANAVKIIKEFRNDYYFVHMPDMHLPNVSWIGFYDDNNTVPEFLEIFKEMELINPEFIIQTGDIVENGRNEEYYQIAKDLLTDTNIPIYITGGNHDLWYTGHDNWKKYLNPVMDYSFEYGSHHYSGMEMFDIPSVTFTAEQMEWIQEDLRQSLLDNDAMRILFYHYDESRQIDADFVDDNEIDLIVYGHTHINGEQTLGSRGTLNLNTSFTMNNNGEYRLIKISEDEVVEHPVISYEKLGVAYSTANDGTNWKMTARIRNGNMVSFEHGLLKFFMKKDAAGYSVSEGEIVQVIEVDDMDVYYVEVNIGAGSEFDVTIMSNNPPSNNPPEMAGYSPLLDPVVYAGNGTDFSVQVIDPDNSNLTYRWYEDGQQISSASGSTYNFAADVSFTGIKYLKVRVTDGEYYTEKEWMLEVLPFTNKPTLSSSVTSFLQAGDPVTLEWFEPQAIDARMEFGVSPGVYTNSINENGNNSVTFTPSMVGMGLGKYYCRITNGSISSDMFTLVVESSQAPKMVTPIGNIKDLSPRFTWEKVQGVPYYMILCSDQEMVITEDENGEVSVEGANPIWSVLTSSNDVPYGIPDPTGTFTSTPAPLIPGNSYWWIVLNCYGNTPELASAVQSGVSKFSIDMPLPDMGIPVHVSPTKDITLSSKTITFKWNAAENASMYHFYPFKIEEELGIEVARGIWEDVIATTETSIDFAAGDLLQNGHYRWKVASVAENGVELHSDGWDFYYEAPAATITLRTFDSKNTTATNDDVILPRVSISLEAIDGIASSLPLSTDLHGNRADYSISPGKYVFTAKKDGYDNSVDTLSFLDKETKTIYFRMNPSRSIISGTVVDNLGKKVPDAKIYAQQTLHPEITKSTSSDAQGNFSLSLIPGSYQMTVSKTEFKSSDQIPFTIESGSFKKMDNNIVLTKNTNTISGTVVNIAQQAVLSAKVTVTNGTDEFSTSTDNNGLFQFVVANGTWTISVKKEGFVSPAKKSVAVSGGSNISVSPPLQLTPNAAIITGVISDGLKLVGSADVIAYPAAGDPYTVKSDGTGNFTLNVLPGTYTILSKKTGFIENSVQVSLNAGATMSGLNIEIEPIENIISGKITTDGYTPVDSVTIEYNDIQALSNDGGTYTIGMKAGTFVLNAYKEGYTSSPAETLTVTQGMKLNDINFILSPNASVIKGQINSSDGVIRNAEVIAYGETTVKAKSDDNGKYVLNLKAGSWKIEAGKTGFLKSSIADSLLIGIGQTKTNVNFQLEPNIATISGKITNASNGDPLRNVSISIPSKDIATETSSEGDFTLVVEPANYELVVFKEGYGTTSYTTDELSVNQTKNMDISLKELQSQFTGKIYDDDSNEIGNILVLAIASSDTFQTTSEADGSFVLNVESGTYKIVVLNDRFITITKENQVIGADAVVELPEFHLELNLGNIAGTVISNNEVAIPTAKVLAKSSTGVSTQTSSDEKGLFDFLDQQNKPMLKPGTYILLVSKDGFQPDTIFDLVVERMKDVTAAALLVKNTGTISGSVTSEGNAILNASVNAKSVTTEKLYSTLSFADGNFAISNIPPGEYKLSVAKKGYSSPASQNISTGNSVDFVLFKNDGRTLGTIVDKETKQPLKGVTVTVDDSNGNGGVSVTDSLGYYDIQALPKTNQYQYQIEKLGYATLSNDPLNISDSLVKNFELQRNYSDVAGKVVDLEDQGIDAIKIYITSEGFTDSTTTSADGSFSFSDIPSDEYLVIANKLGYLSNPFSKTLELWDGANVSDIQFVMKEAKASTIKIIGPDEINNNSAQQYTFSAQTEELTSASVSIQWTLDEFSGNNDISGKGLLTPASNYIGVVMLTAMDSYSGLSTSKEVTIYQNISPDDTETIILSNQVGVNLEIPAGSVQQSVNVQLQSKELALIQRSTKTHEIIGEVYQISPENIELLNVGRLTLPISINGSLAKSTDGSDSRKINVDIDNCVIGYWDKQWLEWKPMEDGNLSVSDDQISIDIEEFGRYCVMAHSDPIGIRDIQLTPNPFSPHTGPLQISYTLSSDQTAMPNVSIKIYNMNGDLVKKLLTDEAQPRGENLVEWDGKTEAGSMALNGRYMMQFIARDTKGKKEKIKLFVLIK